MLLGLFLLTCDSPRQDELQCEEAAAHLDECCDDFDPTSLECVSSEGCDGDDGPDGDVSTGDGSTNDIYPDIDGRNAGCVIDRNCEELRSAGVCDRARRGQWDRLCP